MRRTMVVAVLAAGLAAGHPAAAAPPPPTPAVARLAPPPGWEVSTSGLTWHAAQRVPVGDAAVEFWAGDLLLGRPRASRDRRSFRLDSGDLPADLAGLQVRAAGRRLDAAVRAVRQQAPAPPHRVARLNPVDPGVPGRYATITGEYTLDPVRLPELPTRAEMTAVVVAPKGASGPRPLVLFLHGRHETCRAGDEPALDWPCPPGATAIPSYHGYRYVQRLLASQGYLTVSIAANAVNAQDEGLDDAGARARSTLVRLHLAHWADWSGRRRAAAPAVVRAAPRADLSQVLLVGHSRGGEGVDQAATDSVSRPPATPHGYSGPVRWTVRGVVLIGPTSYNQNPAADVPSVSILPGCDGDVSNLAGQMYVDGTRGVSRGAALHSAIYVAGANHNFFSTEWTDDDFRPEDDPICSAGRPARLTPAQQRAVGGTYVAAAARLFVAGDDRVRPLLDGTGVRARSAGPAVVRGDALGAGRTPLLVPDATVAVRGARLCVEVTDDPATACLDPDDHTRRSPHFASFVPVVREPDRLAVALAWTAAGRAASLRPARPVSLAGATSVALRVIVPPNTVGTRLGVAVTDRRGRGADLGDVTVDGLPGTGNMAAFWAQEIRVPLAGAGGPRVDLAQVAALWLVPRTASGHAWLLDAWGWRAGTPAPRPVALPRIDLGAATVAEGDAGTRAATMPVTVTGRGTGRVRVFVADPATSALASRLVTVHPGDRTIAVRITWSADTRWGPDDIPLIMAKAVRGTTVGDARGSVTIHDDDRPPTVIVTPIADHVPEGGTLAWRITLSARTETPIVLSYTARTPATGPELSTADVGPTWLREVASADPLPADALSDLPIRLRVRLPPDRRTAVLEVPTTRDRRTEPTEHIRLVHHNGALPSPDLLGTVTTG